ncbi:MAG: hypothetical protein RR553_04365 [Akkermansia sp.]
MGQQHRRTAKRRRRTDYIKRKKELALSSTAAIPVRLASVTKKDESPVKEKAEKVEKKAPAQKAEPKKETVAKKAPAKKAPAQQEEAPEQAAE